MYCFRSPKTIVKVTDSSESVNNFIAQVILYETFVFLMAGNEHDLASNQPRRLICLPFGCAYLINTLQVYFGLALYPIRTGHDLPD